MAVYWGLPSGEVKGRGGSGRPQVILTLELASYLLALRTRIDHIKLPMSQPTIKRLRARLGLNSRTDRADWWQAHLADLQVLAPKQFAEKYLMSPSAVYSARSRLLPPPPCGMDDPDAQS
ncbi:hypothetical protein BOC49_06890 [Burkholderia pseudomallei]|nr:hypothetical protein BOC49_06890 [Burkholderia pseudomallei]